MTILDLALLLTLAFIVWLLVRSIYGNHHTESNCAAIEWPDKYACERCGGTDSFWSEWDGINICNNCYDYEVNHDQYWDGRP